MHKCTRVGCDNLADYVSAKNGAICYECIAELLESCPTSAHDIADFMNSDKLARAISAKKHAAKTLVESVFTSVWTGYENGF